MAKPKRKAKVRTKAKPKAKAKVTPKAKAKPAAKAKAKAKPAVKAKSKSTPKSKAKAKPAAKPRRQSPAADVYTSQVADIINSRNRASGYRPVTILNLAIRNARAPQSAAELSPAERAQLEVMWHPMPLDQVLGSEEFGVEVAEVVDPLGTIRYHLYGWNFGVGYLLPPDGMNVIAFASQHDIEHWNTDQRDLFFAMDTALKAPNHGFRQPLSFCWWDDSCWAALAGKQPGTIGSEPHLRQTFSATLAARASS
jgi:hypothetical protein